MPKPKTVTVHQGGRFHWFASSFLNWNTGDDLELVLQRQRKVDNSGSLNPKQFNLWRVPGADKTTQYKIVDYSPDVEGAEYIGSFYYNEADADEFLARKRGDI